MVYDSLGQKAEALKYGKQALSLNRACSDRRGEAYTLNNLGRLYQGLGQISKSIDYCHRALLLFERRKIALEKLSLCTTSLVRSVVEAASPKRARSLKKRSKSLNPCEPKWLARNSALPTLPLSTSAMISTSICSCKCTKSAPQKE